jgi:hypothetical protein
MPVNDAVLIDLGSYHCLGSGKSSALTPHMDALGRTLAQMDANQE